MSPCDPEMIDRSSIGGWLVPTKKAFGLRGPRRVMRRDLLNGNGMDPVFFNLDQEEAERLLPGAVSAGTNSVRNPNTASAWKRGSLGIIDTGKAAGEGLQAAAGGAAVSCGGSCLAEARNTSTAGTWQGYIAC
ncbi:hypothetical protein AKJ16_DCAP15153 [Drosera capensis]